MIQRASEKALKSSAAVPLARVRSAGEPLVSAFAGDPDMAELVEMFVRELPGRISALEAAVHNRDLGQLAALSHQLKGAAGGYGFTPITDLARIVEEHAKSDASNAALGEAVEQLAALCRRAAVC